MNIFIEKNDSFIIRKLVLLNILEINNKRNNNKINLSLNKIDINALLKYFIDLFDKKIDFGLYSTLLETIVLVGQNNEDNFNGILPEILSYIIKLFKLIELFLKNNKTMFSFNEFATCFKKIFPILFNKQCDKNCLNELIQRIISLIKSEKNIYFTQIKGIESEKNIFMNNNIQENYNLEKGDLSSFLSILFSLLNSLDNINIQPFLNIIENEMLSLVDYSLDKKSGKIIAKIMTKLIHLSNNNTQKSLVYINSILNMIEKETEILNVKIYFEQIKEMIELNDSEFLNKNQIDYFFDKLYEYFKSLEIKRNLLIEKTKIRNMKKNYKNKEINDENYQVNLTKEEIENYEDILNDIIDIFGNLLKSHKHQCNYVIEEILKNIIPTFLNYKSSFYIKLALYLCDDLILYLGQEQFTGDIWDYLFNLLKQFINTEDNSIKQICAYGMGIFAQNTKNNFDKYTKDLLYYLYQSLSNTLRLKDETNEDDEDLCLALDNIIAAIGKIIYYHYDNQLIKDNLGDLISKWIMNLPLKWDEYEWIDQHDWMVNLFLNKKELIPFDCYKHYFQCLIEIYKTKYSNNMIDKNIEIIFAYYVKNDEKLLTLLSDIYENASLEFKSKLNILAKQN